MLSIHTASTDLKVIIITITIIINVYHKPVVGLAALFAKCQAASFCQMTFKFEAQGEMRITYEEPFSSFSL